MGATMTQAQGRLRPSRDPKSRSTFGTKTDPPNDVPQQLGDIVWGV